MSDAVIVALITVVVGGVFTALFKVIESKANAAKNALNKNTSEVEAVNKALEGMEVLANNLRIDYDREHAKAIFEKDRADKLELDLIEEKAVNLALSKLIEGGKTK